MFGGLRALHPNQTATAARPHIMGYSVARTTAGDTILELWNGPTNADRRLTLTKDGLLKLFGTVSSLAIVDGIAAPAVIAGYGVIYIDTADGDLKIKYGDGTIKTIVVDT